MPDRVVEIRSLLQDKQIKVIPNEEMIQMFNQYKKLMNEKTSDGITDFDFFYAGWILSNPTVREQFKKVREKEIKFENKVDETVWR